jgi:hypothetical protein
MSTYLGCGNDSENVYAHVPVSAAPTRYFSDRSAHIDSFLSLCILSAERTEEASRALAAKRELQARVEQISQDFEDEQRLTFEIRQDMTRQYKGMQEELLMRVGRRSIALMIFMNCADIV